MPKKWTGDLVGMMHTHKITRIQLANRMGITNRYVSMVLNGDRNPPGAEERFRKALQEILDGRKEDT